MTKPTDAELDEIYRSTFLAMPNVARQPPQTVPPMVRDFARAVLAKWGTPPAVVGEPYGYVYTVQVAPVVGDERKVERTVFTRNKPPCDALALYTTQAQAVAITPPPIECNTEELKRAYAFGWWSALEKQRETAQAGAVPQCWCLTCRPMRLEDPDSIRMALCPTCGNKRCPKANDHRNECTGSNEPGQPGSAYSDGIKGGQHG